MYAVHIELLCLLLSLILIEKKKKYIKISSKDNLKIIKIKLITIYIECGSNKRHEVQY